MSTEYKNDCVEVGQIFLGKWSDHSSEPKEFEVIRLGTEVVLRGKGIGDVIVDVQTFLIAGTSPKGRLRFVPMEDLIASRESDKV